MAPNKGLLMCSQPPKGPEDECLNRLKYSLIFYLKSTQYSGFSFNLNFYYLV